MCLFNKQVVKMSLNHVHLPVFICLIVSVPTFVSFNVTYICKYVTILKQFTHVFQVKKGSSLETKDKSTLIFIKPPSKSTPDCCIN